MMAVETFSIGRKLVRVTAYCPDDAYGIACSLYVLAKLRAALPGPVPESEVRAWLIAQNPEWAEVLRRIDAGEELVKSPPLAVDPSNAVHDLRIVQEIMREMVAQRQIGRRRV